VVDAQGRPLEGVDIFADNQFLYDSNLVLYTDVNGYYRIELPEANTTWSACGNKTVPSNDIPHTYSLTPDVDDHSQGTPEPSVTLP
jgi:hypothetical protein